MKIAHRCFPILVALTVIAAAISVPAADWPQWRGPNRDGISQEKGLLQRWPQEGPKLVWKATSVGSGYSTPSVVGDRLYLLANDGLDNEFVEAIAVSDGKRIWRTRLGNVGQPDQKPSFPAARSTPTVEGDVLYALGSDGDLACLDTDSGRIRWRQHLRSDFGGKPGTWAYAESPLIDGDTLVATPGGSEATLIALHKATGDVIWKSRVPGSDEAAYASALAVEVGGIRQYVQLLQKGLVGVEATTGKFLWRFDKPVSRFNANIPTPVFGDGIAYAGSAGTGGGAVRLQAKDGAVAAEPLYFEASLPTAIGGAVKVGDYLYGTTGSALLCLEFQTGQVKWKERALGAASICFADGRLYMHGENGEVALVEPSPEGYREQGRFTPPSPPERINNMERAWAYPVVAGGKLYLRDQGCLWCYDVRAEASSN
ncbi:MAG: PQQ-like beta-propeller repeat protein [Planctomycetes bacterium]|nr:PQQ-like beta-propeller repeat protein [Planctomycetota bacterium]